MTLAVVGSTAYGVDFHTLSGDGQEADAGTALVEACQEVFASSGLLTASVWVLLNAMLNAPSAIGWLARYLPDKPLKRLTAVRRSATPLSEIAAPAAATALGSC